MMYQHLPKLVVHQFRYIRFVPTCSFNSVYPTMVYRDVDAMYDDFLNHMISGETRGSVAPND